MTFLTEILQTSHKKELFSCGKSMLDDYLHHQASQDIRKKLSVCFVMPDMENDFIKGYYTLSNNSIPPEMIPDDIRRKLPKSYSTLPTTLLGRLAVDSKYHGTGLGRLLLIDALHRSFEAAKSIGSIAVVVDPIDLEAEGFYKKYGFILLPDSKKMFLPMKTISFLF
jgi:GNAT superfamily N-acetyltransferase